MRVFTLSVGDRQSEQFRKRGRLPSRLLVSMTERDGWIEVLRHAAHGTETVVVVRRRRAGVSLGIVVPASVDDLFDIRFQVTAPPWSGVLESMVTRDDLVRWRSAWTALALPGRVEFGGGDRGVAFRVDIARQQGGEPGSLSLSCRLVASDDDPWPSLRWLLFDAPADLPDRAGAALLEVEGL